MNAPPLLHMTGLHLNIQGITNKKLDCLRECCSVENIFAICMCETWLNTNIDSKEVAIKNFKLFRSDRKSRIRGGSAIYLNQRFAVDNNSIMSFSNSYCEVIALHVKQENIALITIYRPGQSTHVAQFKEVMTKVENWLECYCNDETHTLIFGDFNFPYLKWKKYEHVDLTYSVIPVAESGATCSTQEQGKLLLDIMETNFFAQKVLDTTRKGKNTLELIFTNSDIFGDPIVYPNAISDHDTLQWSINMKSLGSNMCVPSFSTLATTSNKLEFDNFRILSKETDWEIINSSLKLSLDNIDQSMSVSQQVDYFYQCCIQALAAGAPKKGKRKAFKGIPPDRKRLMRTRLKLRKMLENSSNSRKKKKLRVEMLNIEREIMKSIDSENTHAEIEAINRVKTDPKHFFRFAKKRSTVDTNINFLRSENGSITNDHREMANILNKQYYSVFNKDHQIPHVVLDNSSEVDLPGKISLSTMFSNDSNAPLTIIVFDELKVCKAIDKMKDGSAPGPDKLTPIFLKKTKYVIAKFLASIMNKSMETGEIPDMFKKAIVMPIFKGGDDLDPKNYRPVSLTSHIVKIMERIIKTEIMVYLDNNNLINDIQHGFRSGRSTVSVLLSHYHDIINALETGDSLDTVLLDYSKAFDRVHHSILLKKVKALGIDGPVGRWIGNFLIGRKQSVKVNGHLSDMIDVLSGVPQGSILGPLLFIIFINDINKDIKKATMSCYADDSKISMKITVDQDRSDLQQDLNKIFKWSEDNSMLFNNDKLEFIRFSRRSQQSADYMYQKNTGKDIKCVDTCKDLGLYFDADASFSTHISGKVNTARKLCGYIFRTFKSRSASTMMHLFKALVLPILEYCCVIWHPYKLYNIREIESIQRDFTTKIYGVNELNYWDRLKYLKVFSLERRRERYIVLYTFKIIFGLVPNPGISWHISERRGRLVDVPSVTHNSFVSSIEYNSFFCTSARLFNCLPKDIRNLNCSMDSIKYNLDKLLHNVPDEPRLLGYTQFAQTRSNSIYDQIVLSN